MSDRQKPVNWLVQYVGIARGSAGHKAILKVYNDSKLCTRYTMTVNDAWCATAVSAAFIGSGLSGIFPCVECSCENMINLAKKAGIWVENDAFVPSTGDVILYDWDDNGVGDCTGWSDHVGIVVSCDGKTIKVIEGNKSNTVGYRTIAVNGRYIRGFITPKYSSNSSVKKTVDELAKEVLAGKWGNGTDRKSLLEAAGYSYSAVQAKVNELCKTSSGSSTSSNTSGGSATASVDDKAIWDYLIGKIGNAYGVAGLMGNLYAESALKPTNLQNSYERSLGYTDATYTAAVDNGSYTNFVRDSAGYGLAQWTYWSRKEALLNYCRGKKASIGNLTAQLEFLYKELSESYKSVLSALKNATSVRSASDVVLTKFERPANQGESVQKTRASYSQTYYDKYAGKTQTPAATQPTTPTPQTPTKTFKIEYAASKESGHGSGTILTVTTGLNFRVGAGTNKSKIRVLAQGERVTWYGYYTLVSGVKWYLVVDKNGQNGFVSSQYLA